MAKILCVGARSHSETIIQNVHEVVNLKTNKIVGVIRGTCILLGRSKSQIITE